MAGSSPQPEFESGGPVHADRSNSETFDLLKATDNELVKKYQPKFLAKGGEHIIYEIPGHPDVVVKVEASVMARIQRYNAERGRPLDEMDPEVLPHVQAFVKENQERYARLRRFFGPEHVLGMKQALVKIPVTGAIMDTLHREPLPGSSDAKEAWAIVRVQKRAPEFDDPERGSVVAGYAELKKPEPETYARVTRALAEGDPSASFSQGDFRSLLPGDFARLLARAETDQGLAASLKEFVEKTMTYVGETGEILDLAGKDNVTVFKKDGRWNYRLVDALYPTGTNPARKRMLDAAKAAVRKAASGSDLDEGEKNVVFNVINFVRDINGMAGQLGVDRRIGLVDPGDRGKVDFLKLLTPPGQDKEKGP